jgi:mannosyltransferase
MTIKSTDSVTKKRVFVGIALALMMSFALYFSLTFFAHSSLRLDEAQSLFQTNRDIGGMLYVIAQDVHVPLYHTLLHYWQVFFGNDIFTARMMSLVFFLATIPAVYFLGSYVFKRRVGLFAALLVTISPFMNWYGSEARMYSMLAFFTVTHYLAFMKLYREGKPIHWVWFTLIAILGMYTHYFFAFVLLAEAVFFLFTRKEFAVKKPLRKFVIAAVLVVGSVVPWLYYVYSLGSASGTKPNLAEPTSIDLFNTYAQFIFGFQVDSLNTVIISLWPILVLLAFYWLQKNQKIDKRVLFFLAAAVVPVIAAIIISVTIRPFYQSRYLIVALPPLLIFISWAISTYPKKIAQTLRIGLVVAVLALFAVQITNRDTPVKENYQEAVEYLEQRASVRDVIVLSAPFTVYPVEYYYDGPAKVTTQPIWNRFGSNSSMPSFNESKLAEEVKANTDSAQTAWLMLSYDQGSNEKIKKYYDAHYTRTSKKEFSKGLWVYSYTVGYKKPITVQ